MFIEMVEVGAGGILTTIAGILNGSDELEEGRLTAMVGIEQEFCFGIVENRILPNTNG